MKNKSVICAVVLCILLTTACATQKDNSKNSVVNTNLTSGIAATIENYMLDEKSQVEMILSVEKEQIDVVSESIEYVKSTESIEDVANEKLIGYLNKETDICNVPECDSDVFESYDMNTEIEYYKYDDTWAYIEYEDGWGYLLLINIDDHKTNETNKPKSSEIEYETIYTGSQFKSIGVLHWNSHKFTWYSQRRLPGGGLKIPGRHVDEQGYVCDENDYIVGASQLIERYTVIDSPFGKKVKIYDWCDIDSVDIYTDW